MYHLTRVLHAYVAACLLVSRLITTHVVASGVIDHLLELAFAKPHSKCTFRHEGPTLVPGWNTGEPRLKLS